MIGIICVTPGGLGWETVSFCDWSWAIRGTLDWSWVTDGTTTWSCEEVTAWFAWESLFSYCWMFINVWSWEIVLISFGEITDKSMFISSD